MEELPSVGAEPVETPSLVVPEPVPAAASPVPQDVSMAPEPSVPDLSSILPSVDTSEIIGVPTEAPSLIPEMPQIPPADVSNLLGGAIDEQNLQAPPQTPLPPPTPSVPTDENVLPPSDLPQMENMGYDQVRYE